MHGPFARRQRMRGTDGRVVVIAENLNILRGHIALREKEHFSAPGPAAISITVTAWPGEPPTINTSPICMSLTDTGFSVLATADNLQGDRC